MQKITVNGEPVSQEMIQFNVQRLIRFHASHGMAEDQIRAQIPELVKSATEQAIGEILLMGEAQKLQFPIPESEIDEQIEEITEQLGGKDKFDHALAERKTSLSDFREQLKRGKRVEKLIAKITETAADPTEAEIEAHFTAHRGEYVKGEQVLAQHILITPDGETKTSKDEARAKIEAIRSRIVDGGADFSDEAQMHSMCPSASEGGSLGWFSRGMMVPEFDKVAFEMKDGEVSDIVETQFGYHIIKKMDHKEESEPSFDEVREQIRDFLRHERRGEIMTAYVEELKAKAKIVRE